MTQTIVCVDDEPALCNVLKMILSKTGATVRTFTDPLSALEFMDQNEVALVVCDYQMPRVNGMQVLARMRQSVPFVMISGDLDAPEIVAGAAGVSELVTKPFRPERLLELATRHLGRIDA